MDCEHEYTICNSLFQTIEEDKIHIWALNQIQLIKTDRQDGIKKQSDFATNWYRG
jgi:hypothetical protein